jgi:hypothetical protein
MVAQAPKLDWKVCDERQPIPACVASVVCSASAGGGVTVIDISSSTIRDVTIPVFFVLVDNYANGTTQQVDMGPVTQTVPAYKRAVYQVPKAAKAIIMTLQDDVIVTVSNVPDFLAEAADEIAIQQAASQFVTYTWLNVNAGRAQNASTDQNRNLLLSNAGAQNYTLLAANSQPNGYYNPKIRNGNTGRWSIVPAGANQINSLWTNANPLRLNQGDQVEFWGDGAQWFAEGHISFSSLGQSSALGATLTNAHGLFKVPEILDVFLVCNTAEFGYSVGDRVLIDQTGGFDGASQNNVTVLKDATNITVIKPAAGSGYRIRHKTLRTTAVVTVASWDIDVECIAIV